MTTERIDVREAIGRAAAVIALRVSYEASQDLRKANAAVAELIEAVETVERIDRGLWAESGRADAMRVLYAALARVGAP